MKRLGLLGLAIALPLTVNAAPQNAWITIGTDIAQHLESKNFLPTLGNISGKDSVILEATPEMIKEIHHIGHSKFKRCGGYFFHESKQEALSFAEDENSEKQTMNTIFADYTIDQGTIVESLVAEAKASHILATITHLSSYKDRYFQTTTGIQSMEWIKEKWEKLSSARSDVKVELFHHASWKQPSVIMTVEGKSSDIIIVGGHGDSIAKDWMGNLKKAPGADDNASGIGSMTEIIRVLMDGNYIPEKTLKFMAYAAEEVGLRGSKEIARRFKKEGRNVIGVLQLDMTNNHVSPKNIYMISDHTNRAQNQFLGSLLDRYVHVSWGNDRCGYACSDHASWTASGYPASMPAEGRLNDMMNKGALHTPRDTVSFYGNRADHALKFTKLGLAFVVELDR